MSIIKSVFVGLIICLSFAANAQETDENSGQGFISDELFIYMHSGAGKNYRIVGTINAGTEIQLTQNSQNDFTQIIDPKGKTAWVESQYVSTTPGLRNVIAELNGKLADYSEQNNQLESQLAQASSNVERLNRQATQLNSEIATLNKQLTATQAKLKDQDTNIKKEWFYNGAIVLGIGLILGLLLPKLGGRRRSNMDNWN